jgi:hypothetical protein
MSKLNSWYCFLLTRTGEKKVGKRRPAEEARRGLC